MDFDEAITELLPPLYARALRLRGQGLAGAELAAVLDIPPEAVGPLLHLAEAKLAALRSSPSSHGTGDPQPT